LKYLDNLELGLLSSKEKRDLNKFLTHFRQDPGKIINIKLDLKYKGKLLEWTKKYGENFEKKKKKKRREGKHHVIDILDGSGDEDEALLESVVDTKKIDIEYLKKIEEEEEGFCDNEKESDEIMKKRKKKKKKFHKNN
jgi:hypothetical protein